MIQVYTERSLYVFDEAGRYLRLPLSEAGRTDWEHIRQNESQWLTDNEWMPVNSVHIIEYWDDKSKALNIRYPGSVRGIITSPIDPRSMGDAERLTGAFA